MLPYRFKKHRSAVSLVREFFIEMISGGIPKDELSTPAHPSTPKDGDMSYAEMLDSVRTKGFWGFSRVTFVGNKPTEATIHYWVGKNADEDDIIGLFAHELGHLAGKMKPPGSAAEEDRADSYAEVAYAVVKMLKRRVKWSPN